MQEKVLVSEENSKNHLVSRENMQKKLNESCKSIDELSKDQNREFDNLIQQRKDAIKKENNLKELYREKTLSEDQLKGKTLFQESEIEKIKSELKNYQKMQEFIENLQDQIKSLETERENFRKKFENTIEAFKKDIEEKDKAVLEIFNINARLEKELTEKNDDIHKLMKIIDEKEREYRSLYAESEEQKTIIKSLRDMEQKSCQMEDLAKSHHKNFLSISENLENTCKAFSKEKDSFNSEKLNLLKKIENFNSEIQKIKQDLHEKTNSYRAETIISQDLRSKSAIIQQKLLNTLDMTKLFQQIKYLSTYSTEVTDRLVEDNDQIVILLLQNAEEFINSLKAMQQVLEIIEDRDAEILILREMIAELQVRTVYRPLKDDPVDEAIADYINSRSEPMPVQFVREDVGVYLFGTKRVFLKLENGKISSNF